LYHRGGRESRKEIKNEVVVSDGVNCFKNQI